MNTIEDFKNAPVGATATSKTTGNRAMKTDDDEWSWLAPRADAEFIADARTRLPLALAALQAVLGMHKRIWLDGREYCTHCVDWGGEYPCPTVLAIQDALGEES